MNAIPMRYESAIALIIIAVGLVGASLGVILHILIATNSDAPPEPPSPPRRDYSAWAAALLLAAALFAIWSRSSNDQREALKADAKIQALQAKIRKPKPPQIVSLKDCPQPGPGLTDTVVLVIHSQADLRPTVTGCSRIAMRPFEIRKPRSVAEAAK